MYHAFLLMFSFYGSLALAIEEPPYTVESNTDTYEIRKYEKVLVAETLVQEGFEDAGNAAFRILADFIFGNNKSQTKIAMTAPVTQQPVSEKISMTAPVTQTAQKGGYLVQFVMPKEFTTETLPMPIDQRITIRELAARRVAVHRYSGSWSEDNYKEELDVFRKALTKDNINVVGEPTLSRFNSPFSLWFLRRNEIWFEIAPMQE
jgi:hypothetical protein